MLKRLNIPTFMGWSWVVIVAFFGLSFMDRRFGWFGIACMSIPFLLAVFGQRRIHCSHICPRGSFFGKFLGKITHNMPLPAVLKSFPVKVGLLTLMMGRFIYTLMVAPSPDDVAGAIFSFMFVSFLIGLAMGIVFKPRSWCQICPMGYMGHLTDKVLYGNKSKAKQTTIGNVL